MPLIPVPTYGLKISSKPSKRLFDIIGGLHERNFVCDDGDCHHHFFKVEFAIFLATKSVLWPKICRKCDSGRGSAPDPALSGHPSPYPTTLGDFGASIVVPLDTKSWRRHWSPPLF